MSKIPRTLNTPYPGVMAQANEVSDYINIRSDQVVNFTMTELLI
jgi:hypothetical protein